MSQQAQQPENQPAAAPAVQAVPLDAASSEDKQTLDKYVLPQAIFFLKQKKMIPLTELHDLVLVPDVKGKMTLRGKSVAADGKVHKASTYLALKDAPKKKRSPRKKRAKVSDAAVVAEHSAPSS